MKSSSLRRAGFVGIALVLLASVMWWRRQEAPAPAGAISSGVTAAPTATDSPRTRPTFAGEPAVSTASTTAPVAPTPLAAESLLDAGPALPDATPIPAALSAANEAATARMVMAHASLRFPEVADAESEANRRILHAMVTKALAHQAAQATTPSN